MLAVLAAFSIGAVVYAWVQSKQVPQVPPRTRRVSSRDDDASTTDGAGVTSIFTWRGAELASRRLKIKKVLRDVWGRSVCGISYCDLNFAYCIGAIENNANNLAIAVTADRSREVWSCVLLARIPESAVVTRFGDKDCWEVYIDVVLAAMGGGHGQIALAGLQTYVRTTLAFQFGLRDFATHCLLTLDATPEASVEWQSMGFVPDGLATQNALTKHHMTFALSFGV